MIEDEVREYLRGLKTHSARTSMATARKCWDLLRETRKLRVERDFYKDKAENLEEAAREALGIADRALTVSNGLMETSHAVLERNRGIWGLLRG